MFWGFFFSKWRKRTLQLRAFSSFFNPISRNCFMFPLTITLSREIGGGGIFAHKSSNSLVTEGKIFKGNLWKSHKSDSNKKFNQRVELILHPQPPLSCEFCPHFELRTTTSETNPTWSYNSLITEWPNHLSCWEFFLQKVTEHNYNRFFILHMMSKTETVLWKDLILAWEEFPGLLIFSLFIILTVYFSPGFPLLEI